MAACVVAYRATVVILIVDQGQLIFAYRIILLQPQYSIKSVLQFRCIALA